VAEPNLIEFGAMHGVRLLADRTRRADLDPKDLGDAYADLGMFLALNLAGDLELEEYPIQHCQGQRTGVRVRNEGGIAVLLLMRAGLYLGQGVRSVLRSAQFYLVNPKRGEGLSAKEMEEISSGRPHTLIIVDSVVNTGGTMRPIFAQASSLGVSKVLVMAAVSPVDQANSIAREFKDVRFYFARLSTNSYVGKGGTDTGNRLFGTPDRE
jgi:uracil phosphoribosyltransferase